MRFTAVMQSILNRYHPSLYLFQENVMTTAYEEALGLFRKTSRKFQEADRKFHALVQSGNHIDVDNTPDFNLKYC